MRALAPCLRMVHIRVQLQGRSPLAFPLTRQQFREIEERCFQLTVGSASGELELPIPGGAFLTVDFAEVCHLDFISGCPSDMECIEAVSVPEIQRAAAC